MKNTETADAKIVQSEKKTGKKKIILIILIAVLSVAAAILAACAVFGIKIYQRMNYQYEGPMYTSTEELYDYFNGEPAEEFMFDLEDYSAQFQKLEEAYGDMNDEIYALIDSATEVESKYAELIDEINSSMIEMFSGRYDVNISGELEKLKVYEIDLSTVTGPGRIMGFYSPIEEEYNIDGYSVYLSDSVVDEIIFEESMVADSVKYDFINTYIHETIHYLGGGIADEDAPVYFVEGLTEFLTEEVMTYCGYEYFQGGYVENKELAQQLIYSDNSFVKFMLEGEAFREYSEITAYLDGKSADGMADNVIRSMELIMYRDYVGDYNKEYILVPQYFMGQYLKYQLLTEEDMIKIADLFVAPISKLG